MNTRKYVLKLTADERTWLEGMVSKGKAAAWKICHAHALLKMDQGEDGPGWDDARIAEAFGMSTRSLEAWRKQAVEEGPQALFERHYPKRPHRCKLDGAGEAQLVKLACSHAPGEHSGWTLNLLAGNEHAALESREEDAAEETPARLPRSGISCASVGSGGVSTWAFV